MKKMVFDKDKQGSKQQVKNLPFISQKSYQQDGQSNKSLYKDNSDSSHLTINPEDFQLHYDKSVKQTLNLKSSFASKDVQNNLSIKKYLKKGEQFNKLNAQKVYRIDKALEQNGALSSYKLPKDFPISRMQNEGQFAQKSNQKSLKKIYLSQNHKKKPNSSRFQDLYDKGKRFSTLGRLPRGKQHKKLVNRQAQTQKLVTKPAKKGKDLEKFRNINSLKMKVFDAIQNSSILQKYNNVILQNALPLQTKNKFINLSSILQKDEQQLQPPKKLSSIRHNHFQTKNLINQSFSGQHSTTASMHTNSYLDSMSKLSFNFNSDVQKIRKNRYDFSQKQQKYSRTIQPIYKQQKTDDSQQIKSKGQLSQLSNKIDSIDFEPTVPVMIKCQDTQNMPKRQYSQGKVQATDNLMMKKSNHHSKQLQKYDVERKYISLYVVPQRNQTVRSIQQQTDIYHQNYSTLHAVNQGINQVGNQQFQGPNSIMTQTNRNDRSHNRKRVKKVDQMVQFPQITQLKVSQIVNGNQMRSNKVIHPIRDNFNQKEMGWITDKYHPKSKLLQLVSLDNFLIRKYRNGAYFGQVIEGKKQGYGIVFYYNGKLYEGQFLNDLKNGKGYEQFPDGSKYQGQFKQGTKNGRGTFEWNNGEVYEGQWLNGKKHGSGIWKTSQGQSYIGEWRNGHVQGFGVYVSKKADRYEGQFKNSQKQGFGTERYSIGQTYVGQYRKNRPNGQGQYFWTNGNYYKGQFVNHLRHGQGYFKDMKKNQIYKGQYRNDKKCGFGQLTSGQIIYAGNFENDYKHGYGELFQNEKCKYKGYWINGKSLEQEQVQTQAQASSARNNRMNVIEQKPELTFKQSNARVNRLANKNLNKVQPSRNGLSKSRSPQNKSIQGLPQNKSIQKSQHHKSIQNEQNSLQKSNYIRACGCSRRH